MQEFEDKVASITVKAKDGTVWRIAEDGAGWLKQQGDSWERSPEPPPLPPAGPASCQTLGQLVMMMAKGMLKKLPQMAAKVAAVAGGVWVLQTYLGMGSRIAWWTQSQGRIRALLGAGGTPFWRWLLWLLISSLVVAIVSGIRHHGPKQFFARIGSVFGKLGNTYGKLGTNAIAPFLIGTAAGLIVFAAADLRLFNLVAALSITMGLTNPHGLQFLVPRLFLSDLGRLLKTRVVELDRDLLSLGYFGFILAGLVGFLLTVLIPIGHWIGLALGVGAAVLIIQARRPKAEPGGGEKT